MHVAQEVENNPGLVNTARSPPAPSPVCVSVGEGGIAFLPPYKAPSTNFAFLFQAGFPRLSGFCFCFFTVYVAVT